METLSYMKPGMGDGGACHPRDNIALRYMSNELHLGYDLFATIMDARDKQKISEYDVCDSKRGARCFFTSDSYKPHVPYVEGSYSLLVQHFVMIFGMGTL